MKFFPLILSIVIFSAITTSEAQQNYSVTSPGGKIAFTISLEAGTPHYSISMNNQPVILTSAMGFQLADDEPFSGNFTITNVTEEKINESWEPVWGKFDTISNQANELTVSLKEKNGKERLLDIICRAYDDGAAFYYRIPEQQSIDTLIITDELTEFRFADDYNAFWMPAHYDSYELLYRNTPLSEIDSANTPVTMVNENGTYIAIHEANLTNYAGMTLERIENEKTALQSALVPYPDGTKVHAGLPMRTPWRTIQITETPQQLLESNMILNLNEPNKLEDISFIEPMKYIGIWWGMHIGKYSWQKDEKHGATTENAKKYIDYAHMLGIRGLLIEGWNEGWENWGGSNAFDFLTPYEDFDLEEVVRYAESRGIAIIGHHETGGDIITYEKQIDSAFALYNRFGITAVKTGYAGPIKPEGYHHHGQMMVNHYRMVVEKAAKYHIMIDAHEPIKPTGISRTYPNMMTREGTRGMEYNAWSSGNPPEHTTILPFTRLLGGPVDYTPGIFDLHFDDYKDEERVHTTLVKQLALFVILYSPLQMAADLPENYVDHPLFEFIREVPVTWNTTVALDSRIGDYVTIAARSGDDWFIGSITDENARTIDVKLDFLDEGKEYTAVIYRDGDDAHWETNPYEYEIDSQSVTNESTLTLKLAPGGGAAVIVKPVEL